MFTRDDSTQFNNSKMFSISAPGRQILPGIEVLQQQVVAAIYMNMRAFGDATPFQVTPGTTEALQHQVVAAIYIIRRDFGDATRFFLEQTTRSKLVTWCQNRMFSFFCK